MRVASPGSSHCCDAFEKRQPLVPTGGRMAPTIPSRMRAAAINRFGGIETIELQTIPVPEIGPGEILIHVEVAGVAVWDPFEREGGFAKMFGIEPKFPYVLGTDGAGTVAAVGPGAESRFAI